MASDPVDEVKAFLEEQWDPDLTVGAWWERLAAERWAAPSWPTDAYGRGLSNADTARVMRAIADHGALGPPGGLGLLLAGPTIWTHGTDEQKERFLPDIVTGRVGWCQLFSEPVAGSDLAGLQTRAVKDGDEYVVNGQKVWSSSAHISQMGMLVARTDPDAPKHKGLTYFALNMDQPGVDVRPLRELTGRSLFNEVFLTDVRVRVVDVIGGLGNGWAVTNTTLNFERAGLGSGSSSADAAAFPGARVGHLSQRAGDFIKKKSAVTLSVGPKLLIDVAQRRGKTKDPVVRQQLARMHTESEIGRMMALRHKALRASKQDLPGFGNIAKLRTSELFRQARELGLALLGPRGMLHDYARDPTASEEEATFAKVTDAALWSPAPPIYGGTDEIQKNILSERVLGLPREPGDDRNTPFKDLRKNA